MNPAQPMSGGLFGPTHGSSLFGATTPPPAPGGLFGPAPVPGSSLFGATTPATPPPAPGGLFGPAPVPGLGLASASNIDPGTPLSDHFYNVLSMVPLHNQIGLKH